MIFLQFFSGRFYVNMNSKSTKELFIRLTKETDRPQDGQVEWAAEDVEGLRSATKHIIQLFEDGKRSHWGPTVSNMNGLCKVIRTVGGKRFESS